MKKKYLAILVYAAMAAVLFLKLGVVRKLFELSLWPDMTFYTNLGLQPGVLLPILGSVLTQVSGLPLLGVLLVLLSLACLTSLVKKLCGDRMVSYIPVHCWVRLFALRFQGTGPSFFPDFGTYLRHPACPMVGSH